MADATVKFFMGFTKGGYDSYSDLEMSEADAARVSNYLSGQGKYRFKRKPDDQIAAEQAALVASSMERRGPMGRGFGGPGMEVNEFTNELANGAGVAQNLARAYGNELIKLAVEWEKDQAAQTKAAEGRASVTTIEVMSISDVIEPTKV
tara:strand:- start:59 stop:505 length:447 start_codon:yes stop_codon:yes gene_type:complete